MLDLAHRYREGVDHFWGLLLRLGRGRCGHVLHQVPFKLLVRFCDGDGKGFEGFFIADEIGP